MLFQYHEIPTLPPLAWCARVDRGSDAVLVFHGRFVETHSRGFIEGAWDDSFASLNFIAATIVAGTGRILEHDSRRPCDTDFAGFKGLRWENPLARDGEAAGRPRIRGSRSDSVPMPWRMHDCADRALRGAFCRLRSVQPVPGKSFSIATNRYPPSVHGWTECTRGLRTAVPHGL